MVVDMGYWTKVSKRIIVLILTIIGIYLAFKLAIFYMPFLIAFIISLLIEPLIKFVNKKTKLTNYNQNIIIRDHLKEAGFSKLKDNLYFESIFPRFNGILNLTEYNFENLSKNTNCYLRINFYKY